MKNISRVIRGCVAFLAAFAMVFAILPAIPSVGAAYADTVPLSNYSGAEFMATDEIEDGGVYIFTANISNNVSLSDQTDRMLRASSDSAIRFYYEQGITIWKDHATTSSANISVSPIDANVLQSSYDSSTNTKDDYRNYRFKVTKVAGKTDNGNQGYRLQIDTSGYNQENAFVQYPYLGVGQTLQYGRSISELPSYSELGAITDANAFYNCTYYRMPTMPYVMMMKDQNDNNVWYWDATNKAFYCLYTTDLYSLGVNDVREMEAWVGADGHSYGDPDNDNWHLLFYNWDNHVYDFILWRDYLRYGVSDEAMGDLSYKELDGGYNSPPSGARLYLRGMNIGNQGSGHPAPISDKYSTIDTFHSSYSAFTDNETCASLGVRREYDNGDELESWMPYTFVDGSSGTKQIDYQPLTLRKLIDSPTVSYRKADGSGYKSYRLQYNSTIDINECEYTGTDSEYFKGWSYEKGGEVISDGTRTMTSNVTVYAVLKESVEDAEITIPDQTYTGEEKTPDPVVEINGKTLRKDTDYNVSYSNNVEAGTATATITGIGDYRGTVDKTFTIKPAKVDVPTGETLTYNGQDQTGVAVGERYTVTDGTETDAGTYTAIATLKDKNNYVWDDGTDDGTAEDRSIAWEILPAKVTIPTGETLNYNGKEQTGVAAGEYYTVTNGSGKAAGTYTATVSLNDKVNYAWEDGTTDDQFVTFEIVPVSATLTFDLAGGTLDGKTDKITIVANVDDVITIPTAPTRKGYKFQYWKGSKYDPGDDYTVKGDHTFTAVWKKNGGGSTGDESNLTLWLSLVLVSAAALILSAPRRRRNAGLR